MAASFGQASLFCRSEKTIEAVAADLNKAQTLLETWAQKEMVIIQDGRRFRFINNGYGEYTRITNEKPSASVGTLAVKRPFLYVTFVSYQYQMYMGALAQDKNDPLVLSHKEYRIPADDDCYVSSPNTSI